MKNLKTAAAVLAIGLFLTAKTYVPILAMAHESPAPIQSSAPAENN